MSTFTIKNETLKNTSKDFKKNKENQSADNEFSEFFLEKFIALNPLYYMDEDEEEEEERKKYCGFSSRNSKYNQRN